MQSITNANFALAIAYVLPGYVAVLGMSFVSPAVASLLTTPPFSQPSVGGFISVTLATLCAGLLVDTIRWMTVERIHKLTGIREPDWNFLEISHHFETFEGIVINHFRFHQFFGGMLVSLILVYGARVFAHDWWTLGESLAFLMAVILLWFASRDTLRKYYTRTARLTDA